MCSRLGMAVQALRGRDMFQALQSGALDAGEFIGPWSDSALGYYQVAKNYSWPGVGEPSSAEECAVNMNAYNAPSDALTQAVGYACSSERKSTRLNSLHQCAPRQPTAAC